MLSYKQSYESVERMWEEGGPAGRARWLFHWFRCWQRLLTWALQHRLPGLTLRGEFRRLKQKLKDCQSFTISFKKRKNILTELCVLPWIETTHVERAFRNANECQKFSNLFPAHFFFPHIFFQLCSNGGTAIIAQSLPVTSPAWWQFKMIS